MATRTGRAEGTKISKQAAGARAMRVARIKAPTSRRVEVAGTVRQGLVCGCKPQEFDESLHKQPTAPSPRTLKPVTLANLYC